MAADVFLIGVFPGPFFLWKQGMFKITSAKHFVKKWKSKKLCSRLGLVTSKGNTAGKRVWKLTPKWQAAPLWPVCGNKTYFPFIMSVSILLLKT